MEPNESVSVSQPSDSTPESSLSVQPTALPEHLDQNYLADELRHVYAALEVSSAGTFSWNERDFTFTWSNGCYRLHGFDPEQHPITYEDFFSRIPEDVRDSLEAKVIASRDQGTVFDTIYPVRWLNGETHWIHARGVWDYDEDGKPIRLFGIGLDADERVAAEQNIAAGEVKLREAYEASKLGSWELEIETDRFKMSETCAELHGIDHLEISRLEALAQIPTEDQEQVIRAFERALTEEGVFDVEHRVIDARTGEIRWVHGKGRGVFDSDGQLLRLVGTNRDITDRRRAELAFVDTARTFRTLTQASPALVFRADDQGLATFFNADRWFEYSGLDRDAWRGEGWFSAFHQDDQDFARRHWEEKISERLEFRGEYRWTHADGSDRWFYFHALPVQSPDRSGEVDGFAGYVGTGTDITALKRSEGERVTLQVALAESQKMEAVGTLASGVAHDFNNMLTAVRGFVELARLGTASPTDIDRYLQQAEDAIDQAKEVTKGLLTFARGGSGERNPVCLNDLVEGNTDLLRQLVSAAIELKTSMPSKELWVSGDETALKQVLTNLIVNSRDAMPSGGLLEVRLAQRGEAAVELAVVDSGVGMSPELSKRIFEPFFSTKEQGRGTGLGLAVAHGTVTSHGGTISVASQPGQGTLISIVLPLCEPRVVDPDSFKVQRGTKLPCRVLLVEDNEMVRESAALRFESEGYEVAGFSSGEEGIAGLRRDPNFDVAVVDVDLPGVNGVDAALGLRAIKPELPVIFITGDVQNNFLKHAQNDDPIIAKPIEYDSLFEVVDGLRTP